jgi:ribosomal protein S18 acetylase RimI-like enzyme
MAEYSALIPGLVDISPVPIERSDMGWTIRFAEATDAGKLPQVERSAGLRFRTIPDLAWLADGDDMPIERHLRYIAQGTEWVALNQAGELLGFLAAEIIQRDLHIWELAVRDDAQGRGIGRGLIEVACAFAADKRLAFLMLTTFADVPWNAPWYERLGFQRVLDDARLSAIVSSEIARGLPGRCAMRKGVLDCDSMLISEIESPEVEAFLAERIYEYNAKATGYFDGKSFSATRRDESGAIRAGVSGYTWGGCCYVSYLWVDESQRCDGVGAGLLGAVERHAESKDCRLVLLATHNFQAPGFYERMGYEKQAVVKDHPIGYSNIVFAKRLSGTQLRRAE